MAKFWKGQPGRVSVACSRAACLLLALALLLIQSCRQQDDDTSVVLGVATSVNAGERLPGAGADPQDSHAVTQAEVDELWESLSEADRQLLEENYRGKGSWDSWAKRPDPGEAWDALSDEERAEYEKQGYDRKAFIELQEDIARHNDIEQLRRMLQFELQTLRPMETAPAGVERGKAIAWRELYALPDVIRLRQMSIASITIGNYDDDPDEEVELYSQGLQYIEQDGSAMAGDPSDDLTSIIDEHQLDMDGNGIPEWLDKEYGGSNSVSSVLVFEPDGRTVFETKCSNFPWDSELAGDVDGDGLDELLICLPADDPHQYELRFVGLGQEPLEVVASCGHMVREEILGLLDFNGDGREDVITNEAVYLSWNSEVVKLEMPAGYGLPSWNSRSSPSLHIWQRNGERLLAALLVPQEEAAWRSDSLALWNAAGALVYLEHFGGEIMECTNGRAGQRLYVLTREQLLVSD